MVTRTFPAARRGTGCKGAKGGAFQFVPVALPRHARRYSLRRYGRGTLPAEIVSRHPSNEPKPCVRSSHSSVR
jgi:hypothetical protein